MSFIGRVTLATVFFGLLGCGSTPQAPAKLTLTSSEQQNISVQPQYLQGSYKRLYEEGKRNQTLNYLRIGTKAFTNGDIDAAEKAFDAALDQIETVYADNEMAHKARSLWYEEGRKDFKGEPYERAMAYYYRGIIYLINGEYDNARASFYSGLLQDAFAEEEQNRADFVSLMYLAGWSALKMGSLELAKSHFEELKSIRPDIKIPDVSHNTLVVGETGKSPRKLADGVGQYELVFRRGKAFKEKKISVSLNQTPIEMMPMEDLFFQASSRGGRPIDAIIEGKASFKQTSENVGEGLAGLGSTAMVYSGLGSDSLGNAGAALSLIGVATMVMSSNVKPKADTRYWDSLPDIVHLGSMNLDATDVATSASFMDTNGNPLETRLTPVIHKYVDGKGNKVIWIRSRKG